MPAYKRGVSVFEDHSDIIRKDFKETRYGHRISLNVSRTSMVLDCQILRGNSADTTLSVEAIGRQQEIIGSPTRRQAVFGGAFASKANLDSI